MPAPPRTDVRDRRAPLDRLLGLYDDLLAALAAGHPPDLDAFDAERDAALAALAAAGPADPDDAAALRAGLEALAERNDRMIEALTALRDAAGHRLASLEQGRRGLGGYRAALAAGRRPGARLGEG